MRKRLAGTWKKLGAALLLWALLFAALPPPVAAASDGSTASGGASQGGGSSAQSAAAGESEETGKLFQPNYEPKAAGVCLVNEESGIVVYEKDADTPFVSASLVKMMTCILAMEYVERLGSTLDDERVSTANMGWVYDELYGKNASTADIRKGETLSVRELLYAAMLPSANEAALILADYVSAGYIPNFLYVMNAKAENLGCTGTVFADPNGLSEENVTTARDMTKIAREFFTHPELREIAGTATYEMAAHEKHEAPYYIHSTNRLLVPSSPYYTAFKKSAGCVVGGKTGSLGEWQNFVSLAEQGGMSYICAVMNSPDAADPIGPELQPAQARPALYETAALYDWAFAALEVRPALDVSEPVNEIRVRFSSKQDTVRLMPDGDVKALLPVGASNTEIRRKYDLPEYLEAPVTAGQVVGSVTLMLAGQEVGTTLLMAETDVERNGTLYMLDRVGQVFGSLYLRVLIGVVVVAAGLYIGIVALLHRRKEQKKQRPRTGPPPGQNRQPPQGQPRPRPPGQAGGQGPAGKP